MSLLRITITPLEMIWHKPIHVSPHLQNMLLQMQKYDFVMDYKLGKDMILSESLGHFPSHKENLPIELPDNIQDIHFSSIKLNISQRAVEQHPVPPYSQWMTWVHQPGAEDCQTLLGHLRWAAHQGWYLPARRPHMHTPNVIQQGP